MQKPTTSQREIAFCPLYQIVFCSRITKTAVFVLLLVICVQPIAPAFADELVVTDAIVEPNSDEVIMEIAEGEPPYSQSEASVMSAPEAQSELEEVEEAAVVLQESEDKTETDTVATDSPPQSVSSSTETQVSDNESTAQASSSPEAATSTEVTSISTATTTVTEISDSEGDPESLSTETASSTEIVEPLLNTTTSEDNYYQFAKDACVRVADGSFYCGTGQDIKPVVEDSFYVALDEDGDTEIFARLNGTVLQVTDNQVTDAAPYYDSVSDTLVWHQQSAGRYQIMSYDFATEKTTQLTTGRMNNMQPHRYGEVTVWQQWGADNWEIMMHDGDTVTALTDDIYADINPTVRGDYVMWHTQYADSQTVTIYDRNAGTYKSIENNDTDLSFSSPRLMLVFEGVSETGVKVAKGYDPETGRLVSLATQSAPLPENIPNSEPTEEVRALVSVKSSSEETTDAEDGDDAHATTTLPVESLTESSQVTSSSDVIVPAFSSISTTTTESAASTTVTIPDLVIPPATSTNTQ